MSPSWSLCFNDLNVQFNRLVNWQHSTGQFSLRNLFFFQTKLDIHNQVMPVAFKGNGSASANFSFTKLFLQPGCQNCILDVVNHFSAAFAAFSARLKSESSETSQKVLSNMSAAAKSMVDYAKSSAAELENTVSLAAVVIKIQDVLVLASYDEAGGHVFGPFNFSSLENSRNVITNSTCVPDIALSLLMSSVTFIMLARGKSAQVHHSKETLQQSLQFQGHVESAHIDLFVNQDRAASPSSLSSHNVVGLKLDRWTLKLLWKFSNSYRPASLDAMFRIQGPLLRLFPQTISSLSVFLDRWTIQPSSATSVVGSAPIIPSTEDSRHETVLNSIPPPSEMSLVRLNVSFEIGAGEVVLIKHRRVDSDTNDSVGSLNSRHLSRVAEASIDEIAEFPLPGLAVKVAFAINGKTRPIRSDKIPTKVPSNFHRRNASRESFLFEAASPDSDVSGHARQNSAGSDDSAVAAGRHLRQMSSASDSSSSYFDHESTNVISITCSGGNIQLSPRILEFLSELRTLMPSKMLSRPVNHTQFKALASHERVAAAKNAISHDWFVLHVVLKESKLELFGDGKYSQHMVSLKVSNSSIIYSAGHDADSSSSIHFVSLSLDDFRLNYLGKADAYSSLSDSVSLISAEQLFLHNTTTFDSYGDESVGLCECQNLIIKVDMVNPDVLFKATRFMQQWINPQSDPAAFSTSSSPSVRKDLLQNRSSNSRFVSEDENPLLAADNSPLNFRERRFFYRFFVGALSLECKLGHDQNEYVLLELASLAFSISNPLYCIESNAEIPEICYTLGWNKLILELSCRFVNKISTSCSYLQLKQPNASFDEGHVEEYAAASTKFALTQIITSLFELDNRDLEEIFFFDVGMVVVSSTMEEGEGVYIEVFYSNLLMCMSSSSIVALRKSVDQLLLIVQQRMAWHVDDAAPITVKRERRVTITEDDRFLPRRSSMSLAVDERLSQPQAKVNLSAPADSSQVAIGFLNIRSIGQTRVHICGISIIDAGDTGMGWHMKFSFESLDISLDSKTHHEGYDHDLIFKINTVELSLIQGPHPILRIDGLTKCRLIAKSMNKSSGVESLSLNFWSDFSTPLVVVFDVFLFKQMKSLMRGYSSDAESTSSRHGMVGKSKARI
jgi:hypothetical protein